MNKISVKHCITSMACLLTVACQPSPEPEKPKGVLRIATVPTNMPIIVNGELKGNSPSGEGQFFSISLEEGEHKVEILKSIDEEKDQYAKTTVFLAADTIPIVTLEAKERLTPFGEQEKLHTERKKAEEVAKLKRAAKDKANQIKRLNSEYVNFLNETPLKINKFSESYNYTVENCEIKVTHVYDGTTDYVSFDSKDILVKDSHIDRNVTFGGTSDEIITWVGIVYCKQANKNCVNRLNGGPAYSYGHFLQLDEPNNFDLIEKVKAIDNAVTKIVKNCQ